MQELVSYLHVYHLQAWTTACLQIPDHVPESQPDQIFIDASGLSSSWIPWSAFIALALFYEGDFSSFAVCRIFTTLQKKPPA